MTKPGSKPHRVSRVNQDLSKQARTPKKTEVEATSASSDEADTGALTFTSKDLVSPKKSAVVRDEDVIKVVLIDEVVEGSNPRSSIDPEEFDNLVQSIRLNNIQQPILCRFYTDPDQPQVKYQVVAGHRRYKAALAAGITSMPILAKKMTDAEALVAAVTENTNRDGMSPRDLILSYEEMVKLDLPNKQIVAAIGGNAKTSKIKKISESAFWREQVFTQGASVRAAYEGAVQDATHGKREPFEPLAGDSSHIHGAGTDESDTLSQSAPGTQGGQLAGHDETPASSDATGARAIEGNASQSVKKGRKRKCLSAVYTDDDNIQHQGYVHLSEISFEGDTARYIAWYADQGGHKLVSLDQLTFYRGCLR